jgi:FkbM family methyltransferase
MLFYNIRQIIRDLWLNLGNPFGIFGFSPQHRTLLDFKPYDSVLHVGANTGQEMSLYNYMKIKNVIWVEPDQDAFRKLVMRGKFYKKLKNYYINEFISENSGEDIKFFRFNQSGANSRFKPTSAFINKNRYLTSVSSLKTINIEDALNKYGLKIIGFDNLLILDTQGSELSILKGMGVSFIKKFKVIMCEFSINQYENYIEPSELRLELTKAGYREILSPIRQSDDAIFLRVDS